LCPGSSGHKIRIRVTVRRTLHDLYCQYFLPEETLKFTRKVMGHSVMLIESGILLIMSISGHNSIVLYFTYLQRE